MREEGVKRSDERDEVFFQMLAATGNVSRAASESGYKRQRVYDIRKAEKDFAEEWDDAIAEYEAVLEAELRRRAVDGIDEPIVYKGQVTNTVKRYSDTLLMFYLKKINPAYRDNHKGDDGDNTDKTPTINLHLHGVESIST